MIIDEAIINTQSSVEKSLFKMGDLSKFFVAGAMIVFFLAFTPANITYADEIASIKVNVQIAIAEQTSGSR